MWDTYALCNHNWRTMKDKKQFFLSESNSKYHAFFSFHRINFKMYQDKCYPWTTIETRVWKTILTQSTCSNREPIFPKNSPNHSRKGLINFNFCTVQKRNVLSLQGGLTPTFCFLCMLNISTISSSYTINIGEWKFDYMKAKRHCKISLASIWTLDCLNIMLALLNWNL